MDQRNSLRRCLENGDVALGASADSFEPTLVEMYGELGLDFVWLDFEHNGPSPWDSLLMENLARAAELSGTELLVRIPNSNPALIRKVLDAGVRNILVPRIDTAEEAKRCVKATRYAYDGNPGERGNSTARSNTWRTVDKYLETEDAEVCLGVMIEKKNAVEELDEILKIPDLGFAFIGPSDLSVQMEFDKSDPQFKQQITKIRDACIDANVPVGCIKPDPADTIDAISDGYQIIRIASSQGAIGTVVKGRIEQIGDI